MNQAVSEKQAPQELIQRESPPNADLSAFLPVINQWVANQSEAAKLAHEIEKEEISAIRESNRYNYKLLSVVVVGVFAISGGMIFGLRQLDQGLLVLSHVGAVIAGLLAGTGLERKKKNAGGDNA